MCHQTLCKICHTTRAAIFQEPSCPLQLGQVEAPFFVLNIDDCCFLKGQMFFEGMRSHCCSFYSFIQTGAYNEHGKVLKYLESCHSRHCPLFSRVKIKTDCVLTRLWSDDTVWSAQDSCFLHKSRVQCPVDKQFKWLGSDVFEAEFSFYWWIIKCLNQGKDSASSGILFILSIIM